VGDRASFKRCRRAWDFGARARQNRQLRSAAATAAPSLAGAVHRALDVYYYPGMWAWPRAIVVPLVHEALTAGLAQVKGPGTDHTSAADHTSAVDHAHALIDAYVTWAADRDQFTPLQVATEIAVNIPDPVLFDRDLGTVSGDPVRFETWLDAVVVDEAYLPWLLCQRVTADPWVTPEVLAVEEVALTDCWAYEHHFLDARMAGVIFNEIRVDAAAGEPFRRTTLRVTRAEIEAAGRQLGFEALEMLDDGLTLYPNPSAANCSPCPFLAPCRAVRQGADPGPVLAESYRLRPDDPLVEGRLGGRTWSMSRGARPNRFGTEGTGQ